MELINMHIVFNTTLDTTVAWMGAIGPRVNEVIGYSGKGFHHYQTLGDEPMSNELPLTKEEFLSNPKYQGHLKAMINHAFSILHTERNRVFPEPRDVPQDMYINYSGEHHDTLETLQRIFDVTRQCVMLSYERV